ncbi:WYL domain-containing protein [Nocardiopsis sp. N85]|uniref:helix-turn-helix transcriptional regulator n=1 Tax=Nocardiopsis sp. N85 TaxID=3029400 RepID=UPI00237F91C0|nr:WYL domain-containing protein [Nocardiopsis sp. N85]MDE3722722.1 WYL domain-containing protein [Nocardiopsis sp. N85]
MQKTSVRLLTLLSLLQARRDWPGALLAERLDVSPRTVRRDIDRLRELGYPVATVKGPDGGYRLDAGADLPPLLFDDGQAVALAVALRLAATSAAGAGIAEDATRALNTVRQFMPARLRRRIDTLEVAAVETSGPRPDTPVDGDVLTTLGAAVHAREVLRFDHTSPDRERGDDPLGPPPRRVEPHHLVTRGGRWYLLAWDLDRDDWRTFRADRIAPRTPTGPRFTPREPPGGDAGAFVAARFGGSDGPGGPPCRGEVILGLPATTVSAYTRDGVVEELGPDRCRLVVGSWSWVALAADLGRFDADIEVVGPDALKDAFALLAERYAEAAVPDRGEDRRPRRP